MSYRLITERDNHKKAANYPPCTECGREYRYGYKRGYYGADKVLCICERGLFNIGGIRSKNDEKLAPALLDAAKKTLESFGFVGVNINPLKEKLEFPSGYKYIITAAYHKSPEVMVAMLNNHKGERSFVVSYEYGKAVIEYSPFNAYKRYDWNWVAKEQRTNADLTYAVQNYLTADIMQLSDADDSGDENLEYTSPRSRARKQFQTDVWKAAIYTSEDVEWEQGRKAADELASQKASHRKKISTLKYKISERLRENSYDEVNIEKLQNEFKQLYWEEA